MAKVVCLEDFEEDCDVEVLIAAPDSGDGDDKPQSVVLYASSALLSEIPFFETSLREPWQQSKRKTGVGKVCVLKLECVALCSPDDYVACFRFLADSDPPEVLIKSVSAAAKIMRCADHLLFKACVDLCMKYLAAAPWSEEDDRSIRDAVSGMGLQLSVDLVARLDQRLDEDRIFKEFFTQLTLTTSDARFFDSGLVREIVKDALTKAPCEVVESFYKPLFLQVWSELEQGLFQELKKFKARPMTTSGCAAMRDKWVSFTRTLLLYTDAKADFAKAIALDSSAFSGLHDYQPRFFTSTPDFTSVLTDVFQGAISIEHGAMVFLSNSERASLLVAWAPVVNGIEDAKLHTAFQNVFITLPPQHPSIMRLVTENQRRPFFEPCYAWWRSTLSKRLKHAHFLLDHFQLSMTNIDYYTKLLAGELKE